MSRARRPNHERRHERRVRREQFQQRIRDETGRAGRAIGQLPAKVRDRLRIKRLRSLIGPADVLTLANGFAGLLAIATFAFESQVFGTIPFPDPLAATLLIAFGMSMDALDGTVARKWGGSQLGGDLDTLCDAVTFVAAPAIMIIGVYGTATYPQFNDFAQPLQAMAAGGLIFLFGIVRLARFNSSVEESETKEFQGLPTPWMAIVVALTVVLGVPGPIALPAFVVLAFLMVSSLAYPKSRGDMVYLTVALVGAAIVSILLIVLIPQFTLPIARAFLALAAMAISLSPLFYARARRRAARGGPGTRDEDAERGEPQERT